METETNIKLTSVGHGKYFVWLHPKNVLVTQPSIFLIDQVNLGRKTGQQLSTDVSAIQYAKSGDVEFGLIQRLKK